MTEPLADHAAYQRTRNAEVRAAVLAHYGQACACCGTADDLTIDHIGGGGGEHLRQLGIRAGLQFYLWLIAQGFPDGYQSMCRPCNTSKAGGPTCRLWHGDPGKKRCTGPCGRVLDLGQFSPRTRQRNDRYSRCRACANAAAREARLLAVEPRPCAWCKGPIPARARRDSVCCSVRCRQARNRKAHRQPGIIPAPQPL